MNPNKKMRRFIVQMPPTVHDDVTAMAGRLNISVAELVRIAVSHWSLCEDGERRFRKQLVAALGITEDT